MPKTPRKKLAPVKSAAPKKKRAAKAQAPAEPKAAKPKVARKKSAKTAKKRPELAAVVTDALNELKALQISTLDVRHLTNMTDTMIIASGRSDRHVRALADAVVERSREVGVKPIGVEGKESGEWVLVDLADVVVHVMLARVREFYDLEKLWDISAREEAVEA